MVIMSKRREPLVADRKERPWRGPGEAGREGARVLTLFIGQTEAIAEKNGFDCGLPLISGGSGSATVHSE